MKTLQRGKRKIQHSSKSIFADQPLVLIEFESITNSRGAGGKTNPTEEAETPKE